MLGDMAWVVVAVDDVAIKVGGVAFDSGRERLSGMGDVADVVCPHPSMRGGVVVAMWWTRGPSKGGDVAWLVIVGIGDEHALA